MTCSILSAIMASTKVVNWARKPGWRIAAKDRFAGSDGSTGAAIASLIRETINLLRRAVRPSMADQGSTAWLGATLSRFADRRLWRELARRSRTRPAQCPLRDGGAQTGNIRKS